MAQPSSLSPKFLISNFLKGHVSREQLAKLLLNLPTLYPLVRYESQLTEDQLAVLKGLVRDDLPGDIIECGVYRGGTTAILARHLKERNISKKIYALDSFSGFKRDGIEEEVKKGMVIPEGLSAFTSNSFEYVKSKIEKLGLSDTVELVPGYFEDTLEALGGPFSLAFVDSDLEKSTEYCLNNLWDKVARGGHLVVDDYTNPGYPGAKIAADRFASRVALQRAEVHQGFLVIQK